VEQEATRSQPPADRSFEGLYVGNDHLSEDILTRAALSEEVLREDHAAWLRLAREDRDRENPTPRRRVYVTYLILLGTAVAMVYEIGANGWKFDSLESNPFFGPDVDTLLDVGAINYFKITDEGEWWRLFVGMWLHAGIIHFVINGAVIVQLGRNLEQLHGPYSLVAIYILSGLFAATLSALFSPFTISVGASGALFGLLGGVWADLIQNWDLVYKPYRQLAGLFLLTVVNVLMGLAPLVDNYQHLGGLIMGTGVGLLLYVQKRYDALKRECPKLPYQAVLQIVGAVVSFNLLFLMLALLYAEVDVHEQCGVTCDRISCVETSFWDCQEARHSCSGVATSNGVNTTVEVDCFLTDATGTFQVDYDVDELTNSRLQDLCDEACGDV